MSEKYLMYTHILLTAISQYFNFLYSKIITTILHDTKSTYSTQKCRGIQLIEYLNPSKNTKLQKKHFRKVHSDTG